MQDTESAEAAQKIIVALAGQRQAMFERRESFKEKLKPEGEVAAKPPPLMSVRALAYALCFQM